MIFFPQFFFSCCFFLGLCRRRLLILRSTPAVIPFNLCCAQVFFFLLHSILHALAIIMICLVQSRLFYDSLIIMYDWTKFPSDEKKTRGIEMMSLKEFFSAPGWNGIEFCGGHLESVCRQLPTEKLQNALSTSGHIRECGDLVFVDAEECQLFFIVFNRLDRFGSPPTKLAARNFRAGCGLAIRRAQGIPPRLRNRTNWEPSMPFYCILHTAYA